MTDPQALLCYDYTLCLERECGDAGLTEDSLREHVTEAVAAGCIVDALRGSEDTTFVDLPEQDIDEMLRVARELRARFDTLVVIGIGGSSLGARATYGALTRPYSGKHRDGRARDGVDLLFVENVDPITLGDLLDSVDLERTAFNVITKSGSTIETMSNFFIIRERLREAFGDEGYRDRVVATTDPDKSWLLNVARAEGLTTFDVPSAVGGRFSVLSSVGLLPLAAAGFDIRELLTGAEMVRNEYFDSPESSVATLFAAVQVALYNKGIGDVVFMPYIERLAATSEWFVQLWAESLGKKNPAGESFGPTPFAALGARDQHSILQLLMEGPISKNVVFVTEAQVDQSLHVPAPPEAAAQLGHLAGQPLAETVYAELRGVAAGLREFGRPTSEFILRRVEERSYGALLMALELATSIAGEMLGINPFDQPGVELGKKYAHGILGRTSDSEYAERLTKWLKCTEFASARLVDSRE